MYYTEREVRELLEQAFSEGYDNGIDDTLDYIDENYELEDDSFDLEEEYQSYNEDLFNTAYRVKKGINFIKHRNSEDRKNANRRDAAKLGIMKGNFREKIGNALADSHRRELYRGGDVVKSGAGMLAAGEYARNGRRFKNRMEKSYKRYDEKINEESFDLMDEYEYYTESKTATKKRNTEIGNKEIEKRFRPINFKNKFDDHKNQITHSYMVSKDLDNNPHYIKRKPSGRISLIRSTDYTSQDKLQNSPYLDRTNAVMDLNKNQIKGAKDETERKDKIRKAKEMYKRLRKNRE